MTRAKTQRTPSSEKIANVFLCALGAKNLLEVVPLSVKQLIGPNSPGLTSDWALDSKYISLSVSEASHHRS